MDKVETPHGTLISLNRLAIVWPRVAVAWCTFIGEFERTYRTELEAHGEECEPSEYMFRIREIPSGFHGSFVEVTAFSSRDGMQWIEGMTFDWHTDTWH